MANDFFCRTSADRLPESLLRLAWFIPGSLRKHGRKDQPVKIFNKRLLIFLNFFFHPDSSLLLRGFRKRLEDAERKGWRRSLVIMKMVRYPKGYNMLRGVVAYSADCASTSLPEFHRELIMPIPLPTNVRRSNSIEILRRMRLWYKTLWKYIALALKIYYTLAQLRRITIFILLTIRWITDTEIKRMRGTTEQWVQTCWSSLVFLEKLSSIAGNRLMQIKIASSFSLRRNGKRLCCEMLEQPSFICDEDLSPWMIDMTQTMEAYRASNTQAASCIVRSRGRAITE